MPGVHAFPEGPERGRAREQAEALWEGVGRINSQLRLAGQWVSYGRPVDAVRSVSPGLWTRAILCANQAMVLVVVNQQHTASGEGFSLEPVESAQIQVAVPGWLAPKEALEITSEGLSPVSVQRHDDGVMVSLGKVEEAKLVVLR